MASSLFIDDDPEANAILSGIVSRVMGSYCVISVIAILIGTGVWFLFPIGDPALQSAVTGAGASTAAAAQGVSVSVLDTIVGIVPKDIVQPFLNVDMLQIIFISVLVGLAAGALSNRLQVFKGILNDFNLVFSRITAMIMGLYSLVGMMTACVNVTGDAAVTLLTAKTEKMLDQQIYRS